MPVPLWTNKAEARYNVTTEFPSLGLHSAAATGNVGLVEYALARGQPINSVLDGVLPLHAAAAGGNERVVKLLIERGADVNAPRLPRRYSNDKNRDTSAPIVGTSGSTPLHFAAANGNTSIVTTLLLRGAHANRADKHGITPEMLARQNGWDECAEVLKSWILNKDRDLRERQGPAEADEPPVGVPLNRFASRERDGSVGEGETSTRRRIHMKRSMDTALSMIKGKGSLDVLKPPLPSSSTSTLPANTSTLTPPPSPMKPFGEYTFYSNSPSPSPIDPGSRRPSLPQITYPVTPSVNRKTSLATRGNPRRPRSAGNGAEGEAEPTPFGRGGAGRKLGSKYSLLNMFKKGTEGSASGVPLERTGTQQSTTASAIPPGSALSSSSSVALPQPESSPGPVNLPETAAPFMRRPQNMSPSAQSQQLPAMPRSPPRPVMPLAVDLHNALAQHQHRDRSGSGASAHFEPAAFMGAAYNDGGSPGSPSSFSRLNVFRPSHVRDRSGSRGSSAGNRSGSVFDDDFIVVGDGAGKPRPGILRAHNRSISNGAAAPAAVRALRFDPASGGSGGSSRKGDDSPGRTGSALGLRGSTSAGSLSRIRSEINESDREPPDSAPAAFDLEALEKTFLEDDDEDEYAYGRPLPSSRLGIVVNTERPVLLADTRPRGQSLSSSSVSSLSPVLSAVDAESTIHAHADFPFSINEPPPVPPDGTSPREPSLLDNRGRGDSVSSTSTTDSQVNPQMSASGTTSGSGSVTVTTPLQVIETLAVSPQTSPLPIQTQLDGEQGEAERGAKLQANRLNERRSHTPLDINLSLISSHAQAEALVQKELQDILEMPVVSADSKGAGWTPLSARLAAYGESLQLERKFRPETTPVDQDDTPTSSRPQPPSSKTTASSQNKLRTQAHRNGVDRQNSLDVKPTSARRRIKEPKRPHTSSGTDSPSTESAPTHHSSRSTSAVSSQTDLRTVPIVAQTAATAAEVVNANYRVRRARTPDPELGLSRVSSLDGIESVDTELGPALTRVSTAPIPPTREKRVLERHIASANKLTRMGFSPAPQTKQDSAQTKRFGGLKSLMQTLKGKPV